MSDIGLILPDVNNPTSNIREITDAICEKYRPLIDPRRVIFTNYVADTVPEEVVLDPTWIKKTLDTLVGNAVRYTQDGRIHVHITLGSNNSISIIVADTGAGIDHKRIENILEAKPEDADGLVNDSVKMRLSAIRLFAESMSGRININTKKGRGTEVTVSVRPLHDFFEIETVPENANPKDKRYSGQDTISDPDHLPLNTRSGFTRRLVRKADKKFDPRQFIGKRVLIVEDIVANQEVLRSLLEPAGCHVVTASDGQEGVELTNTQAFDVILMDIRMPIMNGVEATTLIRQTAGPNQNIPIIALTADASAENNAECLAAGADVFLTKPVVISELFSAIRYASAKHERQNSDESLSA